MRLLEGNDTKVMISQVVMSLGSIKIANKMNILRQFGTKHLCMKSWYNSKNLYEKFLFFFYVFLYQRFLLLPIYILLLSIDTAM